MAFKKLFIYRNFTAEPLFSKFTSPQFSGYDDIAVPRGDFDAILWFYQLPLDATDSEAVQVIENLKDRLDLFIGYNLSTTVILFTLYRFFHITYQDSSPYLSRSVSDYNNYLYSLAEKHGNFFVIDLSTFTEIMGRKPLIDWKYFYLSRMIINPALSCQFYEWLVRQLNAITPVRKKCLVVDGDNTLWGGILGEDGIDGISLGPAYPGSAYKDFQKSLKEAAVHGVLLALCSKNNESDVWELFAKHPDMVLKKGDFVSFRINWGDKAHNIAEIAVELNIGTDSMVFIDDSPIERELVVTLLPEVSVPAFPDQPYKLRTFFKTVYEENFKTYKTTSEDRKKTEQYHQNARRQLNRNQFASIAEYLQSLAMVITIEPANGFTLPRIAQLTQKTNQFNLTTRRYTEKDINDFIRNGALVACASVTDKFGDNGITAVGIITRQEKGEAAIDSYLLSCRILGRGIEQVFLKVLLNHLRRKNCREVSAEYLPTRKNVQAELFYDTLGFKIAGQENGAKRYRLSLNADYSIEPYYTIVSHIESQDERKD